MTEEVKRHATEPFFTTKEKSSNTGLGLSSVEEIVAQSGGFLSIDSAVEPAPRFPCFYHGQRACRQIAKKHFCVRATYRSAMAN